MPPQGTAERPTLTLGNTTCREPVERLKEKNFSLSVAAFFWYFFLCRWGLKYWPRVTLFFESDVGLLMACPGLILVDGSPEPHNGGLWQRLNKSVCFLCQ